MTIPFNESVKQLYNIKNRLKLLDESIKEERQSLKRKLDELQESVKTYMVTNEIDVVNYQTVKFSVMTSKKQNSLTKGKLKEALVAMSSGDDIEADKRFDFIMNHVGSVETTVLRQTKARSVPPKDRPQKKEAKTVLHQPAYYDDGGDDDDDDDDE